MQQSCHSKHELELGIKRLQEFGLEPIIMLNSLKDMDYLKVHPEKGASNLREVFMDDSIKKTISSIGRIDTYKLILY